MKTLLFAVIALSLALTGCNRAQRYAANNQSADQWLRANAGTAAISVAGDWQAEEIGWGDIRFSQSGSSVTGVMGNYSARGVIRGSRAYLALTSGDWVHYTVVLQKSGSSLIGYYSPSVPFSQADQGAVTLRRR